MSGRTELKQFLTPSPGDYEHEKKKTPWEIETERIREARRMSTWQPRYLDALYRTKMRENLPGPNCYNVKGSFEKYFKIPCKCDPYSLEPPPFGQTSKRFDDKPRTDIPGPGTYESFQGIKCVGSIFPAAFGVCATRFKHDPEDSGPGPSDYYPLVGNLAYESEKRYRYTYQKPSYPEIYSDDISFYDDDDDYYDACSPERAEENKSKVYHAAFKSRAERFPNPAKDVPGPGAYEVLKSYKRNRNKCEFLCPTTAPAFGTRSSRMPKQVVLETPDPTYYNLATDIAENVKGGVISQSRRHHERPLAPSPNRYCIHPYLSSSVLKKSFNITLGKPKVVEKLEPTKQKKRCPCRRKKLLWFTVAPREYWECQPETY
ncbi:sperm-tail PG-rich repeat-containing protein 2-like [Ceratina calcarata]|uniref:Sperm-tail PG-rich repeat-containing protein 2-like n=1 Tax=Ceratina calcarata TaxID=156304 RepID=A0AAJ7IU13_9HYME|nr:sperm-tail PG-rich repeat-containing protein 2-like [Ceratina calcarata]